MSRIEELEKRLAADPNSRIFVQLAEEYRKAGLLEQAIEVCEEGLKKHPQYPSARVALGRALLEAESLDRASAEFEAVLKQVPDNILANKFLGETYQRLGRLDEALKKYTVAHTLAPEDVELDEKMKEVHAAMAGGGGGSTPARAPAEAPPPVLPPPAPPPPPVPAASPSPAARGMEDLLDDAPEEDREDEEASGSASPAVADLPPIPLVEVDEPMVLESRDYVPGAPAEEAMAPPPPEPPRPPPPSFEVEGEAVFEPDFDEPPQTEAPPRPPQAPPARSASEIETPTMAEIYASQGHFDRAIAVYRKVAERQPDEPRYRERLEELQMLAAATAAAASNKDGEKARPSPAEPPGSSEGRERTIRVLERWLEAIRKSKGA